MCVLSAAGDLSSVISFLDSLLNVRSEVLVVFTFVPVESESGSCLFLALLAGLCDHLKIHVLFVSKGSQHCLNCFSSFLVN